MHTALLALLLAAAAEGPASLVVSSAGVKPADARRAWDQVVEVERYAAEWQPAWEHPVPRREVAAALAASLATLGAAAGKIDAGVEVLLAAGLTARYAHNLDVAEATERGLAILEAAVRRFPRDPRPRWFLGQSLCEADRGVEGMAHLMAVDDLPDAASLPPQFARDLLACASRTGMPARAARAGRELAERGQPTDLDRRLTDRAAGLLRPSDPRREYAPDEAWRVERLDGARRVTSLTCGFELVLPDPVELELEPVKQGRCWMTARTGSAGAGEARAAPVLLVLARPRREGETVDRFVRAAVQLGDARPIATPDCKAPTCLAFRLRRPDPAQPILLDHLLAMAFEQEAPLDPGLLLERPRALPPRGGSEEDRLVRAEPRQVRFPGTLYYLVLVEAGLPAVKEAEAVHRRALEAMVVE